jgi:hypothetical protein
VAGRFSPMQNKTQNYSFDYFNPYVCTRRQQTEKQKANGSLEFNRLQNSSWMQWFLRSIPKYLNLPCFQKFDCLSLRCDVVLCSVLETWNMCLVLSAFPSKPTSLLPTRIASGLSSPYVYFGPTAQCHEVNWILSQYQMHWKGKEQTCSTQDFQHVLALVELQPVMWFLV